MWLPFVSQLLFQIHLNLRILSTYDRDRNRSIAGQKRPVSLQSGQRRCHACEHHAFTENNPKATRAWERLWCIRKSLCTVHKSQHNCFLHPQRKPNKTKQNKPNAETNWIITVIYHHHHWNLQSHHQHRRSSSSPYRNAKTIFCGNGFCELYSKPILLWKWFLWVVLQTHFIVVMVSRIFNLIINIVVHHHHCHRHRTGMSKPFCCGKPLDVLNCFQQLLQNH